MPQNKFQEVMAKRSTAELWLILNRESADYEAEALEAARAELERRNLSEQEMNAELQNHHQRKVEQAWQEDRENSSTLGILGNRRWAGVIVSAVAIPLTIFIVAWVRFLLRKFGVH
jgi:hypothetical protein